MLDAFEDAGVPQVNQRQLFYADADFDRVVMFYDDWTSQNGDWSRAESDGTVSSVRLDDGGPQQITVRPGFDPGAQADGPVTSVQLITGQVAEPREATPTTVSGGDAPQRPG